MVLSPAAGAAGATDGPRALRALAFVLGASFWACSPSGGAGDADADDAAAQDAPTDGEDEGDPPPSVFCATRWPHATVTTAGRPTELLFARVCIPGVTPTGGRDPDLVVELGHGPARETPDGPGWSWTRAEPNPICLECEADEEEWMAVLVPDEPGERLRIACEGGIASDAVAEDPDAVGVGAGVAQHGGQPIWTIRRVSGSNQPCRRRTPSEARTMRS